GERRRVGAGAGAGGRPAIVGTGELTRYGERAARRTHRAHRTRRDRAGPAEADGPEPKGRSRTARSDGFTDTHERDTLRFPILARRGARMPSFRRTASSWIALALATA